MENVLKDLGISIPPSLRNIETVVGWPKKAVSAMASRSRFDGFTVGDEALASQIDQLVRRCNLKRKYKQACESELIAGCDFVTLSKGADGEPPVIVVTHSAEDGAAKWSERLGRISSGLVIMHYDASGAPDELALYTDEATYHVDGRDALMVTRMAHRMGRPLMEALAYNPTESQPLGQSRITRAVRFITDSGVREALRTEISAEFFITSPQKYLLGVDGDPFREPYALGGLHRQHLHRLPDRGRHDADLRPALPRLHAAAHGLHAVARGALLRARRTFPCHSSASSTTTRRAPRPSRRPTSH